MFQLAHGMQHRSGGKGLGVTTNNNFLFAHGCAFVLILTLGDSRRGNIHVWQLPAGSISHRRKQRPSEIGNRHKLIVPLLR